MKLPDLPGATGFSPTQLRQEIFALGGRHMGEALAGALLELEQPGLTPERRSLLRAVVRHLSSGKPLPGDAARKGLSPPASLADAAYVAVLIGAAIWVTTLVRAMLT